MKNKEVAEVEKITYRQGDVALIRMEKNRTLRGLKAKAVDGPIILAYGEVTGHCHQVFDDGCELLENAQGVRYLSVERIAQLKHQEHATIELTPGLYEIRHQREYTPTEIVRVRD